MLIKIHRGAHEIGGSCLEIEHKGSRIIVDIGLPLYDRDGQKFDLAQYQSITDPQLVKQGILPDVAGLYDWDTEHKPIDGVLISHAHLDHYGLYRFVNKAIPCYAGAGTKKLIDLTATFTPYRGTLENCSFMQSGVPLCCGSFRITPYLMDHSAFDAYAFLIEAQGKSVIYSGDFREHGRKAKAFYWFMHNAPRKVDALILEGTMFGRTEEVVKTEIAIEKEITFLLDNSPGIVFFYTSGQNIDRLVSFYKAACKARRLFLIDVYTATILDELKEFANLPHAGGRFENVRVFYPELLCRRMRKEGHEAILRKYRNREIKIKEISDNAHKIVMMTRSSMLNDLYQIANTGGGIFIYSLWGGYLQEKSMESMLAWIRNRNLAFYSLHTSGHATVSTLKKVVHTLRPQQIIPIHTFYPQQYAVLGAKLEIVATEGFFIR